MSRTALPVGHDAANDQDATYDYFVSIVQGSFSYDGPEGLIVSP